MLNKKVISPLKQASQSKKTSGKSHKKLVAAVILTSLVDAFSILVVYLLVSFSESGEILHISKDMELPQAAQFEALKLKTHIKVEENKYFLEDQEVAASALVAALVSVRKELAEANIPDEEVALTVQGDRRLEFSALNRVIRAGSHAGFTNIQFAILAN